LAAPQLEELSLINNNWPAGSTLPPAWGNFTGTGAFGNLRVLELAGQSNLGGPLPSTWLTGFPKLRTLQLRNMASLRTTVTLSDWISMLHVPWRWSAVNVSDTRPNDYMLQMHNSGLTGPVPLSMFTNNRCVLLAAMPGPCSVTG
jgi:hypothetical protein